MNVLFVCSRNQWRSLTAETVFKNSQTHAVKSAGTAQNARVRITEKLLNWADIIFVMEAHHRQRLQERFRTALVDKEIIVLDIPDHYSYMDAELIEILTRDIPVYLGDNQ